MQVVVFTLGGERYALPIARVQEVIRHAHPRPVGSRLPFVAGVIELRGRIVPVCDIAAGVGARATRAEQQKIVIVDLPGGRAGVLVDAVDEVVTVPDAQLAPVPVAVRTPWLRAIARLGEDLVMVLEPERLLAGVVESVAAPVAAAVAAPVAAERDAESTPAGKKLAAHKPAAKRSARKPAARKPAAKRSATTPAARKPAAKHPATKSAARKPAAKKPPARKTAA
jgi:purine-binding chemotaxis protein CheW